MFHFGDLGRVVNGLPYQHNERRDIGVNVMQVTGDDGTIIYYDGGPGQCIVLWTHDNESEIVAKRLLQILQGRK